MEYRNATHIDMNAANCEVNHPQFGWIPFTATPYDPEDHGRDIYARIVSDIGDPDPDSFSGPSPEELRASMPIITARQLRLSLLSRLDDVEALIAASNDRALQIEWEYATTFERLHPAIVSIGAALGLTEDEIDAMWLDAANT